MEEGGRGDGEQDNLELPLLESNVLKTCSANFEASP